MTAVVTCYMGLVGKTGAKCDSRIGEREGRGQLMQRFSRQRVGLAAKVPKPDNLDRKDLRQSGNRKMAALSCGLDGTAAPLLEVSTSA